MSPPSHGREAPAVRPDPGVLPAHVSPAADIHPSIWREVMPCIWPCGCALLIGRDGQDPGPGLRAAIAVAIVEHAARACTPRTTCLSDRRRCSAPERGRRRRRTRAGTAVRPLSLEYLDEIAFRAVVVGGGLCVCDSTTNRRPRASTAAPIGVTMSGFSAYRAICSRLSLSRGYVGCSASGNTASARSTAPRHTAERGLVLELISPPPACACSRAGRSRTRRRTADR